MKKIELTNHEKMLVELCVRHVLCGLLDKDADMIDAFTAGLWNLAKGHFGDQELESEIDPNDWVSQLDVLRSCLRKLETQDWKVIGEELGGVTDYKIPEEYLRVVKDNE